MVGIICALWVVAEASAGNITISLKTDKEDPVYHIDEPVVFTIKVNRDGQVVHEGVVKYTISKDVGGPKLSEGCLTINNGNNPLILTTHLSEPGMIFCQATYDNGIVTDKASKCMAQAGAAVDPLKIKPSMPTPKDFDTFWNGWKKKLQNVPMNAVLKKVKWDTAKYPDVEIYDLTLNCLGPKPVRAYIGWPKQVRSGSCPAIANFYPYNGLNSGSIGWVAAQAVKGRIAIDVNAHGIELGQPQAYYDKIGQELGWFPTSGEIDRNQFYFLWMYLRDWQALQYVKSLPQWDGKVLIVTGSSMGGGQALAMGGLEPQVSLVLASVPAMCDHSGFKVGRVSGWARQAAGAPSGQQNKILKTLRYFDGVNFASRIKGRAIVSCGFLDGSCPSTSVYAAFNAITSPDKQMIYVPTRGHGLWEPVRDAFEKAIEMQIKLAHPESH